MSFEFKKPQPRTLRLWHWLNAFAIFGLLGTVFLRKTFLSWRTNAQLIEDKAAELGASGLTAESAAVIARAIRDPMWQWHYVLGFALVALIVFRAGVGLATRTRPPVRPRSVHHKLVKVGYAVFYAAVTFMGTTGVVLFFKAQLGLSKELTQGVKESHEAAIIFFALFVAAHLMGVVVAELRGERGLVSDMINGGDQG